MPEINQDQSKTLSLPECAEVLTRLLVEQESHRKAFSDACRRYEQASDLFAALVMETDAGHAECPIIFRDSHGKLWSLTLDDCDVICVEAKELPNGNQ